MKKVLALVLAAIMVCTMAFAVTVNGGSGADSSTATFSDEAKLTNITPGKNIEFTVAELLTTASGTDLTYLDNGKFVPERNFVTVTFGAGSVASQGWVKTGTGTAATDYTYIIKTVASENALDNTADLVIDKIVTKVYGRADAVNTFNFKDSAGKYAYVTAATAMLNTAAGFGTTTADVTGVWASKFDVGYAPAELVAAVDANGVLTNTVNTDADTLYTVKAGTKPSGATSNSATFSQAVTGETNYTTVKLVAKTTFKTGDKFHATTIAALAGKGLEAYNKNVADSEAKIVANFTNANTAISLPAVITIDNAKETYKLYVVADNGTVALIPTTWDATNGVLSANVATLGRLVLVDGTLSATGTVGGNTTTTNPETGANDVIGVAAALAVVALVSGAAISLKK